MNPNESEWFGMNRNELLTCCHQCRCHYNLKFSSNNLTLALKSWIEPESPGLNVPFHGSTDCSAQLEMDLKQTGNGPEVNRIWIHVPKSGGGISFVIGSRENCWKTAVEAYFRKVLMKYDPSWTVTTPNQTLKRQWLKFKLWQIMVRVGLIFRDSVTKWITRY